MRYRRYGLIAFVTFLASILSVDFGLPVLNQYFSHNSQVLAQTPDARKAEAARLFQQGNQQFSISQFEAALQSWQQALTIYREIKDRQGEGQSLGNLGFTLFKSGNLTEAERTLRTGIEVLESQRARLGNNDAYKISIFEQQARTYRTLQKVLIAQNKTNDALEIAEGGRARAFVDLLATRLSP